MPKLPQTPRVSIVIPLQRDEARFEETLLSVLENQPGECQIVAVHNGTYADPFDLEDEVTFATARSSKLVDLIRDAYCSTRAPLVHVLTSGMRATTGWIDEIVDRFDDSELGATAATLADHAGHVCGAAAWSDVAGRHCQPLSNTTFASRSGNGFFLNGFSIRRRLLGGLLEAVAPAMVDPVAVAYAFSCLVSRAGWRIDVARDSALEVDESSIPPDQSDLDRGICLSAIRDVVLPDATKPGVGALLQAALLGSSSIGEMVGMLRYRSDVPAMRRSIDPECVPTVDEMAQILTLTMEGRRIRRLAA